MNSGKRQLLVYFIFLLLLPGMILAYFAFRGIQNDQALLEKENREMLNMVGRQIIDSLRSGLQASLSACQAEIDENGPGYPDCRDMIINVLVYRDRQNPYWLLPTHDKVVKIDAGASVAATSTAYREAWNYEFQEKSYRKAIRFYEARLRQVQLKNEQAFILNALSRLYRKAGAAAEAIQINKRITRDVGSQTLNGGIPMGWIARLTNIGLFLDSGKENEAVSTVQKLFTSLLIQEYNLNWEDFEYMFHQVNEMRDSLLSKNLQADQHQLEIIDSLAHQLEEQFQQAKYQHAFRTLVSQISLRHDATGRKYHENAGYTFLYEIMSKNKAEYIFIYDLDRLRQLVSVLLGKNERISWELSDRNGSIIQSGSVPPHPESEKVMLPFPPDLPAWNLDISGKSPGLMASLTGSGRGVFAYILLFIVILLITGIVFTLRTINSELKLSQMKSDFISTVSHEFKSPLTAIRQMTERLERNRVHSEDRKMEYYRSMHAQTVRLSHLIDNILDFSRLESGEKSMLLKPENLNEIVLESVSRFEERLIQQSFPVETMLASDLPEVSIDRAAMIQVIENLMDNALKYAPSDKGVLLETAQINGKISLDVTDHGPGIEKAYLPRIFERFYRGGAELTRTVKGSGIGLALAKKIVEGHGGNISVESEMGKGTTFTITIPVKDE